MKKIFSSKLAILISVGLFAFAVIGCKEGDKSSMRGVFTFVKGTVTNNGQVAKLGDAVKEGDLLISQKKSTAVVQFSSGALVTLRSTSELKVSALSQDKNGKKIVALSQKKGSTFSKIVSSENVDYSISAPTLTAGVRGTSFGLNVSKDGSTEIKLLKGKVAVAPDKAKAGSEAKELLLSSGNKIKVTGSRGISEPQKLTSKDTKELSSMNKIELVPNVEKAPKAVSISAEVSEVISAEVQEYTLKDLEKEYGKISKIVTKSGKIYVGNFAQKGGHMVVRTTDGQFSVPSNQVEKVSLY